LVYQERVFTIKQKINFMDANYENRFRTQAVNRLDRLDGGLKRIYTYIKRNENAKALHFMDNELKDLYMGLEDIIKANRDSMGSQIGTL
jgi:hypothetical protein